jgi:hypothetical protein
MGKPELLMFTRQIYHVVLPFKKTNSTRARPLSDTSRQDGLVCERERERRHLAEAPERFNERLLAWQLDRESAKRFRPRANTEGAVAQYAGGGGMISTGDISSRCSAHTKLVEDVVRSDRLAASLGHLIQQRALLQERRCTVLRPASSRGRMGASAASSVVLA